MEDNIQTIIIGLISTFLLFIFPVYMAYEKKDDVSYALAIRHTQNLVDEVRSKGYITYDMYTEYANKLRATGNSYDIQMTHTYFRYDPVTNYYKEKEGNLVIAKTTTQEEREKLIETLLKNGTIKDNSKEAIRQYDLGQGYKKVEYSYKLEKEIYDSKHILNILQKEEGNLKRGTLPKSFLNLEKENLKRGSEAIDDIQDGGLVNEGDIKETEMLVNAYTMNVDDNFNITIRNTNTTLATVIYNMVTIKSQDVNTRIYVNYGGIILNSRWFDNKQYAKSEHDIIEGIVGREKEEIFLEERTFTNEERPVENILKLYKDNFAIEFDAYPSDTTELRDVGTLSKVTGFNFAVGNNKVIINNGQSVMSISVGINGISIIAEQNVSGKKVLYTLLSYPIKIDGYVKIKVEVKNNMPLLYINDMKVAEGISVENLYIQCVGKSRVSNTDYNYIGKLKNVVMYNLND